MIETNALSVNGKSTADFPFTVYVEENDGFQFPKKKNLLTETQYATGAIKNNVEAWSPIVKEYTLYCPGASLMDMREIKRWAKDHGKLIAADEPDVYYEIIDVSMSHSRLNEVSGYRVAVQFTTQPFGFELFMQFATYANGDTIHNLTNAPMYPLLDIYGSTESETYVTIGKQTVRLKKIWRSATIECKYLEQDVFDDNGKRANSIMQGDFFVIPADSENKIKLGPGITRINMYSRWAWL